MNTKYKTPVLLVESDPNDAQSIEGLMEDVGFKYDFHHAATLFEGFELLRRIPIDIVLLNLNLKDTSGFRTIATYLDHFPGIPVIALSDAPNEIIGNQAIKAGAQDYLVKKQFDGKTFGRAVRFALQRSKVQMKLEETARELELSKRRFLEAQKMAHFGNWSMDLVTNEMHWSDEVFRIFSFQPGTFSPSLSDYLNYVHLEDRPGVEAFFEKMSRDGSTCQHEHRIIVGNTTLRHVTVQGKVRIEEGGERVILEGNIQDITERKLSDQLIIEKNLTSQTAKIQEEVLSDLGFQIRTPLSSIVNLVFLLDNTPASEQQQSYLNDLKASLEDLSMSVNNLVNFTVMVSGNVKADEEEFKLQEFLQGMANAVRIKADKARMKLNFEIDKRLPEKIVSDPRKLTQILYNLVDNAIRNTPENGEIAVIVKAGEPVSNKLDLSLSVRNNGAGFSKEKLKELLHADKMLESLPEEKGELKQMRHLGLAIVAKLTKMLEGSLDIESKEGAGAEFKITLPVKAGRKATVLEGDVPDMPLKILLVEDHFLNQIATKKVLTSWSEYVAVDIAENGLIAVEKFKEYGYDVILMDIQMPVMNGLDAAQRIREISQVPIIALTANSTKQEQDNCLAIGMNDYLAKPFQPKELYSRILNVLSLVAG
ncbi:MAG: response regulator [Lewinellaceae bacterium]|nr:response regulator [Saprospiraceae bacterium]MCB9336809.1 response regulator [Lewinellaceae bacterium]